MTTTVSDRHNFTFMAGLVFMDFPWQQPRMAPA